MPHFCVWIKNLRRPKVYDLDRIYLQIRVKQQILGLKISVYYFTTMAVDYCTQKLLHDHSCLLFIELSHLTDLIKELPSINVLSYEVEVDLILVELVDLHYVWMIQLFQNIYLIQKGVNILLTQILFADYFHSPELPRSLMLNLLDLTV